METKNRIEIADISNIKYFKYGRESPAAHLSNHINLSRFVGKLSYRPR
jgi:hypothetical protein